MAGEEPIEGFATRRARLWPSIVALAVTAGVSVFAQLRWELSWLVSAATGFCAGSILLLLMRNLGRRSASACDAYAAGEELTHLREKMEEGKMRAVACLASQIAHDVRNPVAAISGSAQLLSRLNEKALNGDLACSKLLADEQSALCRAIIEESSRLDAVISRFQSFAELSDSNLRTVLSVSDHAP